MMQNFTEKVGALSRRRALLWGLVLASVIEALTAFFRFGLDLQATRDTAWMAPYTFGIRDHHLYYGALLIVVSLFLKKGFWRNACLIIGIGCFVSDLAHHFLVLWPITGSPQFDLTYPNY